MIRRLLLCLIPALGVGGCSEKFADLGDSARLAFFGEADIVRSQEEIESLPYSSIYAKIEGEAQAFLVLAFAEDPINGSNIPASSVKNPRHDSPLIQLKWLSANNAMLVTANGRLVTTHNLPIGNLTASFSTDRDPILIGLHLPTTPRTWHRRIDWQPGYHMGYELSSEFSQGAMTSIDINGRAQSALYVEETISIASLDLVYHNSFWIDPDNGIVLKSRQKIAPTLPFIEITLLKPYS